MHMPRATVNYLFLVCLVFSVNVFSAVIPKPRIAVFGGSGYVGRRISRTLIGAGCEVVSISRNGQPPNYYCQDSYFSDGQEHRKEKLKNWSDLVTWVKYDVDKFNLDPDQEHLNQTDDTTTLLSFLQRKNIDAAVSCIGDLQPDSEWLKSSFFGLGFDDERLFYTNGILNEKAMNIAKIANAKRFVYISVSYEVAKMVEGPLEGYMNGKRHAEHVAFDLFNGNNESNSSTLNENVVILGPSLIYGGKRFPKLGKYYRMFQESFFCKAYVKGNESLRKLSAGGYGVDDWVEKVLLSCPPITVQIVANVACASLLGYITREIVGDRRQGFFDTNGQPVFYDNALFIDGTEQLEQINNLIKPKLTEKMLEFDMAKEAEYDIRDTNCDLNESEPPYAEGALIGKGPLLFPIPVVAFFSTVFYLVSQNAFVSS